MDIRYYHLTWLRHKTIEWVSNFSLATSLVSRLALDISSSSPKLEDSTKLSSESPCLIFVSQSLPETKSWIKRIWLQITPNNTRILCKMCRYMRDFISFNGKKEMPLPLQKGLLQFSYMSKYKNISLFRYLHS